MIDDFILRAVFAGIAVCFVAGPIGCFVLWRKVAYFGDATAHSAVLGIAFSLALNISVFIGVFVMAFIAAICITITTTRTYSSDTVLGILAHSSLAIGLLSISFVPTQTLDLEAYLFGQILAVSSTDIIVIGVGSLLILAFIITQWEKLLIATLSEELSFAAKINPLWYTWGLNLSLAILVALSIKLIGILLISGLLIIPAATAKPFSKKPSSMAVLSVVFGCTSVILGVGLSYFTDTPTGPSIISVGALFFCLAWAVAYIRGLR